MVYDMKKSQMARVVEFDKLVNSKGYPNVHRFSVDYEVSGRTIARDIEYLRDTLGAPLEYDLARNGYYYSELRAITVNDGLIVAVNDVRGTLSP
jgi:proteasome accessory factor B